MTLNDPEKQINQAFVALSKQNQDTIKRLLLAEDRISSLVEENYEVLSKLKRMEEYIKILMGR